MLPVSDLAWLRRARVDGGTYLHALAAVDPESLPAESAVRLFLGLPGLDSDESGSGPGPGPAPGGLLDATDYEGRTALMCAVRAGNVGWARLLFGLGADASTATGARGETLVQTAAARGDGAMLRLLLEEVGVHRGVDLGRQRDADEAGPLHRCVAAAVGRLLAHDPGLLESTDYRGRTPLIEAQDAGLVSELLARGASVAAQDDTGATAAHWAAFRGRVDLLRLLAAAGADMHGAVDRRGLNVLHEACAYVRLEVAEYLVGELGVCVHTPARQTGYTPLHYAMERGSADLVRLLLRAGASLAAQAFSGPTALDVGTDALVLQALEWVPSPGEFVACAAAIGEFVGTDVAVLVQGMRCAGQAAPPHGEAVAAIWDQVHRHGTGDGDRDESVGMRVAKRRRRKGPLS
jgi:ankyrin repeat protein